MEIEQFVIRAEKAEQEIKALSQELQLLLPEKAPTKPIEGASEELEKLRTENNKLKYRIGILQRATVAAQNKKADMNPKDYMLSILSSLENIFRDAVIGAFPDLPDAPCPITVSAKFGDYQFNGAMAISGLLKVVFKNRF